MKDVSIMTTQERLAYLSQEDMAKYAPTGKRTTTMEYLPKYTQAGGQLYIALLNAQEEDKKQGIRSPKIKIPHDLIYETQSFRNKLKD